MLEAHTGEAALTLAAGRDFALVVCDVRMPGLSGEDVLQRLAAQDPGSARRYVLVTGDGTQVGQGTAPPAGTAILVKPFTATDLDTVLSRLGVGAAV